MLLLGLVLSGCGTDSAAQADAPGATASSSAASSSAGPEAPVTPSPTAAPGDLQYVALGDSYAAAPGVPTSDMAGGCFRSDNNYAHLLAAGDDSIFLTDVTCSGATSDDVITKQVPALSEETDLVTVGIGGNDFNLFTSVLSSCLAVGSSSGDGAGCTDEAQPQVDAVTPQIQGNIGRVLDAVTAAAPEATVLVVGYPALLPASGSCPALVPVAEGDYPLVASINRDLSDALRAEAERRDLTYVDVFAASTGHDICSDDPWVNGITTAEDGTIPFHPFAAEQAAVAELIDQAR